MYKKNKNISASISKKGEEKKKLKDLKTLKEYNHSLLSLKKIKHYNVIFL